MTEQQEYETAELAERIVELLNDLSYQMLLSTLAKVFIFLGLQDMGTVDIDPGTLIQTLTDFRQTNGETVGTAMVQQGIVLLGWVSKVQT